jgi:uncharacterized protein YdeI (YjbR/CyaY-like superfamily)
MLIHKELPVLSFASAQAFEAWLADHYQQAEGFWLRYFKKGSGQASILHEEAVDIALCWGWIDGLINKYDEASYLVRFTPRRPKSIWSKVNVAKVAKLTAEGRMQPSGLAHVELAKQDGRWDRAYEPQSKMEVPPDFIELVKQDAAAYEYYLTLNRASLYSIGFRLGPVTDTDKRAKKMAQLLAMLRQGQFA